MGIDFLLDRFQEFAADEALVWREESYTYGQLLPRIAAARQQLRSTVPAGSVVALEADYSPNSVALLLALIAHGSIVVPRTRGLEPGLSEVLTLAQAEWHARVDAEDTLHLEGLGRRADHPLYATLRRDEHPGLVLFSSGSTGQCKAAVHDLVRLLERYRARRHRWRTIPLLLFDHIGGLNTLFYTLANGGCLVVPNGRSPDVILEAVQRHRVELLPTSPTFLNLMLLSEAHRRYDLRSLRTISYGTEPMPETTLRRLRRALPEVQLRQTYGMSEIGILRCQSKDPDSLWLKLGGAEVQTRVVAGVLQIKSRSTMLGYLNAPSPLTDDGWLVTGDAVQQEGDYYRILGRQSELINVGGRKVYPAEVENVIQELDNVVEVTVYGERNPIVGQIVCARVTLQSHESAPDFHRRLLRFCQQRLAGFQIPLKTELVGEAQHSLRLKRIRPPVAAGPGSPAGYPPE